MSTTHRSMKAGAFTPAILVCAWAVLTDSTTRSMKAGAFTPAILLAGCRLSSLPRPLNEGGGLHPRNPVRQGYPGERKPPRSMKAGAFTPAIRGDLPAWAQDLNRSMKAGAFTPAILGA